MPPQPLPDRSERHRPSNSRRDFKRWGELPGAAASLAVAKLSREESRPLLMLCASDGAARRRHAELRFFSGDEATEIVYFPDRQTLPYDSFSPAPGLLATRLAALHKISSMSSGIVVSGVESVMHRLAPRRWLGARSLVIERGQKLDTAAFSAHLQRSGYARVEVVRNCGEYAIRGGVVDLYPAMLHGPIRLELLDVEIDGIRGFDPDSQRGMGAVESLELLPAREFSLDEESTKRFSGAWHDYFDSWRNPAYERLSAGEAIGGAEYYLPLFFEETQTLFDYLPPDTLLIDDNDACQSAGDAFEVEVRRRRDDCVKRVALPPLPPETLFLDSETLQARCRDLPSLAIDAEAMDDGRNFGCLPAPELPFAADGEVVNAMLDSPPLRGRRILRCASEPSAAMPEGWRRVTSWKEFDEGDIARGWLDAPALSSGALLPATGEAPGVALLCESGMRVERVASSTTRDRRRVDVMAPLDQLGELEIGDLVVHEDYGVGRYLGLRNLETSDGVGELLMLEYADGDQIHMRMDQLSKLSLFNLTSHAGADSDEEPPRLDAVGVGARRWRRRLASAERGVRDVAADLMRTSALRALNQGPALAAPEEYLRFAAEFAFDETPDQALAIEETLEDLRAPRPMDRLICGDVGLGKTEVAMRAAFVAGMNGFQTVILTPTTLLAEQHLESFRRRFQAWPLRVEKISRLSVGSEYKRLKEDVASGKVDILIGTHRLLRSEIGYGDLGLLIIDEEHRFGLRDKERFKEIRADVNLLSMTATPIPRTLNMALGKLRDLSLIATPPENRMPIRTTVAPYSDDLVREAIGRELHREGQVFHQRNRVADLHECAERLGKWFPEASIGVVHGRMPGARLERVMENFRHRRHDILVCTTIIESGLDVPNANTIIIEGADKLGLAQLHQLRGRVGRFDRQAYAWLLTPPNETLSGDARRRLRAVVEASELGSGYQLASADLDIRGGGELLGRRQSGHIEQVGLGIYARMLERAVANLRGEPRPEPTFCEVELERAALIPEKWIPDMGLRLRLYQRIAAADADGLAALEEELADRFGRPPQAVADLLDGAGLRLRAKALDIRHLKIGARGGELQFNAAPAAPLGRWLRTEAVPAWREVDARTFRVTATVPSIEGRVLLAKLALSSLEERRAEN